MPNSCNHYMKAAIFKILSPGPVKTYVESLLKCLKHLVAYHTENKLWQVKFSIFQCFFNQYFPQIGSGLFRKKWVQKLLINPSFQNQKQNSGIFKFRGDFNKNSSSIFLVKTNNLSCHPSKLRILGWHKFEQMFLKSQKLPGNEN